MAGTGISQAIIVIRATDLASRHLDGIGSSFAKLGSKIQQVGLGMTAALSMPIAALAIVSANAAVEFDKQMRRIQVITDQTDSSLQTLGTGFIGMSIDMSKTTDTAAGLAAAYFDIAQRGYGAADAQKLLEVATKAGVAGFSDTLTAAKAIGQVLQAYGMDVSQAMHVSDVMFRTIDRGVITFDELATGMAKVTPIAALTGVSIEELGAAISALTLKGVPPQQALTALYRVMVTYLKSTGAAKAAAAQYGIELSSQTLKTMGLLGAIQQITTATDKYGNKLIDNENDLAAMFTRQEGLRGAMLMAADSATLMGDSFAYINNSIGQTDRAYSISMKKWESIVQNFKNTLQALAITVGNALLPVLKGFGDSIANVAKNLAKLPQEQVTALVRLGLMIAALGPAMILAGTAISVFGGLLNSITPIVRNVINAFTPLISLVPKLTNIFSAITGGIAGTVVALKASATGLVNVAGSLAWGFRGIVTSISIAASGILKSITAIRYTPAALDAMAAAMRKGSVAMVAATSLLGDAAFAVKMSFLAIGNAFKQALVSIPGAASYLSRSFSGILLYLKDSLSFHFPSIIAAVTSGWAGVKTAFVAGGASFVASVKGVATGVKTSMASFDGIRAGLTSLGNAAKIGVATGFQVATAALSAFMEVAKLAIGIAIVFSGVFLLWKNNIFEFRKTVDDLAKSTGFLGVAFTGIKAIFETLEKAGFLKNLETAFRVIMGDATGTLDIMVLLINAIKAVAEVSSFVVQAFAEMVIFIKIVLVYVQAMADEIGNVFRRLDAEVKSIFLKPAALTGNKAAMQELVKQEALAAYYASQWGKGIEEATSKTKGLMATWQDVIAQGKEERLAIRAINTQLLVSEKRTQDAKTAAAGVLTTFKQTTANLMTWPAKLRFIQAVVQGLAKAGIAIPSDFMKGGIEAAYQYMKTQLGALAEAMSGDLPQVTGDNVVDSSSIKSALKDSIQAGIDAGVGAGTALAEGHPELEGLTQPFAGIMEDPNGPFKNLRRLMSEVSSAAEGTIGEWSGYAGQLGMSWDEATKAVKDYLRGFIGTPEVLKAMGPEGIEAFKGAVGAETAYTTAGQAATDAWIASIEAAIGAPGAVARLAVVGGKLATGIASGATSPDSKKIMNDAMASSAIVAVGDNAWKAAYISGETMADAQAAGYRSKRIKPTDMVIPATISYNFGAPPATGPQATPAMSNWGGSKVTPRLNQLINPKDIEGSDVLALAGESIIKGLGMGMVNGTSITTMYAALNKVFANSIIGQLTNIQGSDLITLIMIAGSKITQLLAQGMVDGNAFTALELAAQAVVTKFLTSVQAAAQAGIGAAVIGAPALGGNGLNLPVASTATGSTTNVTVNIEPGAVQVISESPVDIADRIVSEVFRAFSKAEERTGYPALASLPGAA